MVAGCWNRLGDWEPPRPNGRHLSDETTAQHSPPHSSFEPDSAIHERFW